MTDEYKVFPCGCRFKITGVLPDGSPSFNIDGNNLDNFPFTCEGTWKMLAEGYTKGVFQLESRLGKQYCKKLKPDKIDNLVALGAILRPGCMQALDEDGISITDHYCKRKNNEEEITYDHESLKPILVNTFGQMVYQESLMSIARLLAGFNDVEVDKLRKCVTGDTMFVSKTRGWISIDRLLKEGYENDLFLTMDFDGIKKWKKISKIWSSGKKDVNNVKTRGGYHVWATKYHQFATHEGWKARRRLEKEDYLLLAREVDYDGEDKISEDLAMVIAGLITEGYFVEKNAHFTNFDEKFMGIFADSFRKVFNREKSNANPQVFTLQVPEIKYIGQYMSYGLSADKNIPNVMMGMTKETTRKFLSFMLGAECGVTKKTGRLEYSSKSLVLTQQVQLLLLRFGIYSNIHPSWNKDYECYYYKLNINCLSDQKKLIEENLHEFWPEYKYKDLIDSFDKRETKTFTSDVVPPNIVKKLVNQYPFVGNYEGGSLYSQPISRDRFTRTCEKSKDKQWLKYTETMPRYEEIETLEEWQKQRNVYDFSMEDENTPYIVANGLIIHNSVGKKQPDEMIKIGREFVNRAEQLGIVDRKKAQQIWDMMEKSGRYLFCLAHSTVYGILGWITAYLKYHFPIQFFTSYLEMASDKPDPSQEVYELVEEAKLFDIEVVPPDIRHADEPKFSIKDGKIYFSLLAIKGLGESHITKVQALDKEFLKGDWTNFLIHYSDQLSSTTMVRMIETGALRLFKKQRQEMLYEYTQVWSKLTDREKEWIRLRDNIEKKSNLADLLKALAEQGSGGKAKGCGCSNKNRLQVCKDLHSLLTNNPVSLIDSPRWIAWCEEEYLGVAITCNKIDEYEVTAPTCTCKEYIKGFKGYIVMGVEIKDMRIFKIKKEGPNQGKEMASITFTDGTATMESVPIFADTFDRFKDIVAPGQFLMLEGERGRGDTFMINHINLLKGHKT